jgi:hypothetical protein
MNKKKIVIGVSVFILSAFVLVPSVSLADYWDGSNIPDPQPDMSNLKATCVSVPGIPCPGDSAGKASSNYKALVQPENPKTGDSQAFKDLLNINKIINSTVTKVADSLRNIFDNVFNNIKNLFKKNKL